VTTTLCLQVHNKGIEAASAENVDGVVHFGNRPAPSGVRDSTKHAA
jgi:hypothetical protein